MPEAPARVRSDGPALAPPPPRRPPARLAPAREKRKPCRVALPRRPAASPCRTTIPQAGSNHRKIPTFRLCLHGVVDVSRGESCIQGRKIARSCKRSLNAQSGQAAAMVPVQRRSGCRQTPANGARMHALKYAQSAVMQTWSVCRKLAATHMIGNFDYAS